MAERRFSEAKVAAVFQRAAEVQPQRSSLMPSEWEQIVVDLIGAGLFAAGAFRLPGWARERAHQMKEVADRVAYVAAKTPTKDQ